MPVHTNLPLRCLEMTPATPSRGNVVLLHGLGATLEDLVSVVDDMKFPARHLLLDGSFTISMGEHYQGRAWYQRQGNVLDGLEESVHKIRETLNALNVAPEKTVLVGFSQGAAVALATVLASETTAAGLCMLSGYVPQPSVFLERRARVQDLCCLLCHGIHDDVVPFKDGLNTLDLLASHGARARLVALPTSHWVAVEMVVELRRFLDERLPAVP
jgi:phospholipase/carboxylesterase